MEELHSASGESIKVFVRVRPPDPHLESEVEQGHCLEVASSTSLTIQSKPEPKIFTFDHVAGMSTTQEDVFSAIGRPIIESCMRGYNGTIFAYGQTGSGKTFTMIGPCDDESDTFTHQLRGVIPRSFEYIFSLINREKQKFGELVEFLCKGSFLEIYNEQVYDLLDPASAGLHLRENIQHGVYVDGLTEHGISSARDAYDVLTTGWVNRRVASTSMNRESSRSHAVFTLSIESKKRESKESVAKIKTSLLNLVDLAGSERQRDANTAGLRLKEASSINKSLSALGNVIMSLVDIANGKSRHVPYRDSKLTFLLRDSLGGNAKTNLVANVHPSARCFGETLSTLNFARRTKMIKNKAVVNEDTSGNVLQLQAEIKRLRDALERFKAGMVPPPLSPTRAGVDLPDPSAGFVGHSDDEKAIQELRGMLENSIVSRDRAESEKTILLERIANLEKLCSKKEKFLQSTKMILKFRETHIENMEKRSRAHSQSPEETGDEQQEVIVKLLQQEIEQLKYKIAHHPDVTKFAMENLDLRAEIKKLRSSASGSPDLSKELARTHHYTLQLERQLRHYLSRGSQVEVLSPSKLAGTPSKAAVDQERLQARCRELQGELNKARHILSSEREEFQLKESKLEASLASTKKANLELERSIEALKLKSSVEKATLNDMHMNTIRSMLSPRRDVVHASKSVTNTPFRRADSDPIKTMLNFSHPQSAPASPYYPPSIATIAESPQSKRRILPDPKKLGKKPLELPRSGKKSVGVNTDISGEYSVANGITELNIEGALTDELKILQDSNRSLQQQLEDEELAAGHVLQEKTALEAQLAELTQQVRTEREVAWEKERELLEKVTGMTAKMADLTSTNTVLDGEVLDLRLCLQSADRELAELKEEAGEERKGLQARLMEHMQRVGELEQRLSSRASEEEQQTQELQNLRDEVETLREEATFKDHCTSELEQAVLYEKERAAGLEVEVQSLLEKLTVEVEKNVRLSSELQEGHSGKQELVAALNENSRLEAEVQQLESDLRTQLASDKKTMEESEASINSLLKRQAEDKEAITGLMSQVQELRVGHTTSEARVASLQQEVEDSSQELSSAAAKIDQLTAEVEELRGRLGEQATQHEKEMVKKDSEREVVYEELERLTEQYQQMTSAFEAQSIDLAAAQSELRRVTEENSAREAELKRLYQHKRERRESITRAHSFSERKDLAALLEEKTKEIESIEQGRFTAIVDDYEQQREEKNRELQHLKSEMESYEKLQFDLQMLETRYSSLQYAMACSEDEFQHRESTLDSQLKEAKAELEQLQVDYFAAVCSRDEALAETVDLRSKCQGQRSTVDALADQLERYKSIEEKLFTEKENLKSQLEALQEEKTKLAKECENLAKENALITGHHNLRQRIQYHASVKMENSKLKEEMFQLQGRLKVKNEELEKLQKALTDNRAEFSRTHLGKKPVANCPHAHSDTDLLLKENIHPQSTR